MLLLYSDKDGVRAPRFHCYELHLKFLLLKNNIREFVLLRIVICFTLFRKNRNRQYSYRLFILR